MRIPLFRRVPAALLLICLTLPAHAQDVSRDWAAMATSLQPGARIELDLADGTHVQGTVLAHERDAFVFAPRTRLPVSPWRVAYSEIRAIELKPSGDGLAPGTQVLIGIGAGAGVFLLAAVIAVASMSD